MKLENTAERITKLCDVVQNNKKHQHYARVVSLADTYKTFITGQGLDENKAFTYKKVPTSSKMNKNN